MSNIENKHTIAENNTVKTPALESLESKSSSASKKAGNKNALFHGVFSNEIVLPWESAADFENLYASFKDEWNPTGCSEEQAVFDLAHCTWIKWRASKMAVLRFHRVPFGNALLKSGKSSWQDILQHEQELPQVTKSTLSQVDVFLRGMNSLLDKIRNQAYDIKASDGKETQMKLGILTSRVSDTIETNKEIVDAIKNMAILTGLDWTMFDGAYQPEVIEQDVKVMAAIDARIDKILRRLTSLKEYKRIAASQAPPPQMIASPSVAPAAPTNEIKQT